MTNTNTTDFKNEIEYDRNRSLVGDTRTVYDKIIHLYLLIIYTKTGTEFKTQ